MFEDLIPAGAGQQQRASADVFDDLVPSSGSKILQAAQGDGGFVASAKQSVGALVKGAGQFAGDFVPGVGQDNPVKRYGQEVIDSNPTAVHSLDDIGDMPGTALKEATGNAAGSMAGMVGARLIGQGVTAAAPLAGPAAPLVAGAGQAISWLGPYAVAALPSFGGIREQQVQDNPEMADSTTGKAVAALGAGTVGVIENKFGPQEWALSALTKTGRDKLAEKFAAKSLAGSIGKGMLHGAAVEGGEELVQNPIEQLAGFQDPTTPENVKDTVFSGAMGSLGGGMFGGPIAGLSHQAPAAVSVLRADGQGATTIDPATGPLSAAAAEHIQSQQPASMPPSAPVEEADVVPVTPQASSDLFADLVPEEDENDRIGRENLAAWGERANVLPLEHAQTIAASRPDLMVVEHPAGGGHTVVPRDWLSASQQQAAEALQAPVPAVDPLVEQVAALPVAEQRALAKRLGTKGLVTNKNAQEKIFAHPPEAIAKALAGESSIQSIDQAAQQANTDPTDAQKAAGNYAKGHIKVGGLDIAVENPVGSTRSGTSPDGKAWSVTMSDHYGYVKRTEGADGDQVDVYVKAGTAEDHTGPVFIVDQFDPKTGRFDEHKAMIGYKLKGAAIKAYDVHFADGSGPKRRQTVTKMSAEQFKDWVRTGDTKVPASVPAQTAKVEDFGEKIGGARKDTAQSTGPKPKAAATSAEVEPGWRKRFTPIQNVLRSDPTWNLFDTKTGKPIRGAEFKTEQSAKDAIPMIAVAQKHRVTSTAGGFEIMRDVSDRKRVKVVDQVFPTRDDAMAYMAKHAQEIIETKTSFREELFARPEKVMREGAQRRTGPASAEDFSKTFGFRGVEFGNWNNQDERQEVMNHAFDGLLDLADVLGVAPKALSLNGDLALAFGARGQGLSGAVAHYERNYGVINLTKMQGAGALAHEWMHAADHYFGRQDGKASSEKIQNKRGDAVFETDGPSDYASHGLSYSKSGMREELRTKYQALIKTLFTKAEQYVEDTTQAEKFVGSARDALVKRLTGMRESLEKPSPFGKRYNKPATAEQLAEFDRLAADVIDGKAFTLEARAGAKRFSSMRLSNDTLDALSNLYKAVRGRSGMNAEKTGVVDAVRGDMRRYADRVKMLDDARNGSEKSKAVPTRFAMDAKRIDQGSATDYWTTPHEMVARAFSAYVEDKLPGRSDFLSYGSRNSMPEYRLFNVRPFPEGEERVAINRAFDDLMQTLETRETDKGVELFNQAGKLDQIGRLDQLVYGLAAEGKSSNEILQAIAKTSAAPFNRQLARLLIAKGVSAKVTVGDAKGWAIHAGPSNNYAAAYNPKTNTASLFRPASAERHLLHEMVHAATLDALGQKSLASGQLKALFHHVQTKLGKRSHYGLTNAEEFLAEAFTNRKFQQVLSRMAAPESSSSGLTSAWNWFLRIVRGILGMDAQSESALSRALELGVDLMAPAVKSADVLSRFNSERLAPNGKPSKLDDEQYQQVRTPQFKAWFGDWETAALRDFLNGSPLADLQTSEAPHRGYAALREWAVGIFRDYGFKAVHPVIGEVQMDERAVRDSMGHRISPAKAVAFKAVPDVIENGRIVHVATRGLMDSIYISAPVRINDVDDVVTVLVHRDPNTQRFYLHSVSTKDNLLKPKQSGAPVSDRQSTPGAVPSGDVHNILHQALTFKGATSKVIDENGEPLVVFHGTRDGGTFTEFQPNERGLIFAASTRETAASYAGRDTDVDLNDATKQRGVIPLFLNIRSPLEKDFGGANYNTLPVEGMDAQTDILGKQARKAGNDGAILRNLIDDGGDLPDMTDVETPADIFIAFDPKQLKSATQNAGSFDATYPDLRFNVVDDADRLTVKDWLGHQLANQRSWALGALTRDQLADIYGERMPEVAQFDRVVQEMDQARNIIAESADAIIERWRKLKRPEADQLADLMHQATLAQFDPDTAMAAESPEQAELLTSWETLSPEAQQLYRDVRDQYAATLAKLRNGLSKRAERAGTNGQRIAAEIRLQFDKYLAEGPYFPLARFGDFVLIADKGAERIVEAFESSAAREKRARQLRVSGWTTKLTAKKAYSATKDGPAGEFVGDVLKLVDGLEMDAKEKGALMDSLNQLAISSLPDQSYRRHFTHRKGTPGYSQDAMRAFAASMQHVGHHVARVLHGDELTLLLDSLNKQISETTGDVDTTVQQQVANELAKRLDLMMNPTTHPVTAALGQVGFVMSLGGSVASGLTNLSQTPLITFPWLGAKFGFDKAAGALTKASKDYFGGPWDKWSGFVLKDNKALTGDEKRALQQLEDAGLINLTQTSDLASTATTDSASSSRSWAINRAMKLIGWTFSVPEVFNRQVSALAAYRLAVEKGQTHGEAVETALETLRRTHFDYSASNRSRWMAGNFTRVVTMFKQYSQQMTYLLWRNAYQALKGESPEVRREARRMLLGVAAMHFGAAGALGLPLGVFGITPLLGLLSMGMGDGDDPWDWETEFRNMLADVFGKAGGEAIAHGPVRALLNVDFASRVGLGDLWVRSPQGEQEGRDLVEAWMLTLLGPVAGYAANLGTAAGAFNEGKTGRGLEAMLPKMLAAPLKATRYETEGVKSWRGDDLGVALDTGDILGTALGFNPTKVAEMNEGRAAIKGRESKLTGRREEVINQWMAATIAGDQAMQAEAMQMAMKFNKANPSLVIRADSLQHSLHAKLRNQAMIKDGVYLQKRRQDLRAEGRFANVAE